VKIACKTSILKGLQGDYQVKSRLWDVFDPELCDSNIIWPFRCLCRHHTWGQESKKG